MKRTLPKGKVTVNQLLVNYELREFLAGIEKIAPDVGYFVFCYDIKEDGSPHYSWSGTYKGLLYSWGGTYEGLLGLLESAKNHLLNPVEKEGEE